MKVLSLLVLSGVGVFLLSGCGANDSAKTKEISEVAQMAGDFAKIAETAQKAGPNDAEAGAKAMEKALEIGASYEVKEFEKTESVDLPAKFPSTLVYTSGKVTSSHENSYEGTQDQNIEIKTLDEVAKIREFYKAALGANGWKLSSQENTSGGSEYSASTEDGGHVNVTISSNTYSKIAQIRVSYSKTTTPQ